MQLSYASTWWHPNKTHSDSINNDTSLQQPGDNTYCTRVYEIKVSIFHNFLLLLSFWKHSINDIWLDSALFIQVVQIKRGRTVATRAFANYAPVKHDYITLNQSLRINTKRWRRRKESRRAVELLFLPKTNLWKRLNYRVIVYSYYWKRIGTYFVFTRKFWEFI